MTIKAFFKFIYSNYIPEVRIMSIPNLRYMKVSTLLINRNRKLTDQNCVRVYVGSCVYLPWGTMIEEKKVWNNEGVEILNFLNWDSWQQCLCIYAEWAVYTLCRDGIVDGERKETLDPADI